MSKLNPVPDAVLDATKLGAKQLMLGKTGLVENLLLGAILLEVIDDLQALRTEHATLIADSAWKAAIAPKVTP